MKQKTGAVLLLCLLLLSLIGCTGISVRQKVGIAYPSIPLLHWSNWTMSIKASLEDAGYEVDLRLAGDDPDTQISQIEEMIADGCDLLVIIAVDPLSLESVLAQAEAKDIPVIAYDRMILGDVKVDYYITFDNLLVGTQQGQFIEEKFDLKHADGPFNIEIFIGDPGDSSAGIFHSNAMSLLQPYIDSGKIRVLSDQIDRTSTSTAYGGAAMAQFRMKLLINAQGYAPDGIKLDAVICSNDAIALGVTNALLDAGYTAENFPVITGQGCDKPNVNNMMSGLQAMSVFKDVNKLEDQAINMIDAILQGKEPEISDSENYSNDRGKISTYLCAPVVVTIENYKEVLLDSGYYDPSEFEL